MSCEFSEQMLLPDQLAISEVSQKRYALGERETSVHTGRAGHRSEFVASECPAGPIARDEAGTSDHSGRVAAQSLLVTSAVPPHRTGLPDEVLRSAVSDQPCLPGEEVRCAITHVPLLPDEPVRCAFSDALVAPDQIIESQVSGRPCRSDLAATSVLSGRKGHASEFVVSQDPEGLIAADEAGTSDISGLSAAKDRLVASDGPSGKRGLRRELETCAASGAKLFSEEMGTSSLSGQRVDARLLVASGATGRVALAEEMQVCEVSGAYCLPTEVATSDVSGKLVDRRLLVQSAASDRHALSDELVTCAESGAQLMPAEVLTCAVSETPVDRRKAATCAITGRRARPSRMKSADGEFYIDDSATASENCIRRGSDCLVYECPLLMREFLMLRMRQCTLTGALVHESLVKDEALAALRPMLDGWKADGVREISTSSLSSLGVPPDWRKGPKRVLSFQPHPDGAAIIVVERKGLLGFGGLKVHAALLKNGGSGALVGKPLEGKRDGGSWVSVP